MQLLTFSRMSALDRCPRYHYLRYERGVRPNEDAAALRFGSVFHAARENPEGGNDIICAAYGERFPYEREECRILSHGWSEFLGDLPSQKREIEFRLPLINPDTGQPSRTFELAGKIDGLLMPGTAGVGGQAMEEIKTCSESIDADADYWIKLRRDLQISTYMIAARRLGFDVDTVIYSVCRKATIDPLQKTSDPKFRKDGEPYANTRLLDETPEEYGLRLWGDIQKQPTKYYARQEIPRLNIDLERTSRELWQRAKILREFQLTGNWYRNPAMCAPRGGFKCEYHDVICDRRDDDPLPSGWRIVDNKNPELTGVKNVHDPASTAAPSAASGDNDIRPESVVGQDC